MDSGILRLVATVIEACSRPRGRRRGHPPAETLRVVAALSRFLREGTPWRGLSATGRFRPADRPCGRCLARWAETGLLARGHALLVGMLRGHPDLILDSCSVRAKRGGDLTGPNPTDRAKRGTKYHVAVDGDGVPVACAATAKNVNATVLFERLILAAFAVMAHIRTVLADGGCDAERNRSALPVHHGLAEPQHASNASRTVPPIHTGCARPVVAGSAGVGANRSAASERRSPTRLP
jgi:hypothetical protein